MKDVVIVNGTRTAIGAFGGALRDVPPLELAQHSELVLLLPGYLILFRKVFSR